MLLFGKKDKQPSELEKEINRILKAMSVTDVTSKDYYEMASRLDQLTKVRTYENQVNELTKVVVGAVIYGGFSLASILIILKYEKFDTVLSKAVQFIPKWRV
jgi:hypothetical protein